MRGDATRILVTSQAQKSSKMPHCCDATGAALYLISVGCQITTSRDRHCLVRRFGTQTSQRRTKVGGGSKILLNILQSITY
jgi:hypothetical protein